MSPISLSQMAKLAKLAAGDFSLDQVTALLEGFGLEVAVGDVHAERKADVFQRVAQFSLQPGTELKHMTMVGKDGLRAEFLIVLRSGNESNSDLHQKKIDARPASTLSLSHST